MWCVVNTSGQVILTPNKTLTHIITNIATVTMMQTYRMQSTTNGEVILQLHHHVLPHQGLEERVEQHGDWHFSDYSRHEQKSEINNNKYPSNKMLLTHYSRCKTFQSKHRRAEIIFLLTVVFVENNHFNRDEGRKLFLITLQSTAF